MKPWVGPVFVVVILVALTGLFIWQVRLAEPADFVLPAAIPVVILAVAALVELQSRIGRWLWRHAGRLPPGDGAADYDEGEAGEAAARATAGGVLGCFGGCAGVLLAIPLWASPGLAAILVAAEQHERAQQRAITEVYGEAAYAAGVRIAKKDMLNTGVPAHPDALRIYWHRSWLPHLTAFLLTLLVADWLLRRHFGEGYNGKRPLIELGRFRRPAHPPRRAWPTE